MDKRDMQREVRLRRLQQRGIINGKKMVVVFTEPQIDFPMNITVEQKQEKKGFWARLFKW